MNTVDRFWEEGSQEYKNPLRETTAQRLVEELSPQIPYNLMEMSEELWKEFPEFENLKGAVTGEEDDEITIIQKVWWAIERLQMFFKDVENSGFAQEAIRKYDDILRSPDFNVKEAINELEQINNPDYKNFLDTEKAKLDKMNSVIDKYVDNHFGPLLK